MSLLLPADLRHAIRSARQRPLGFLVQAATVALVVGAGSTIFPVADATLIRSLPFPRGHELAQIFLLPPDAVDESSSNPLHSLDLVRLRERLTVATGPAGIFASERSVGGGSDPESVLGAAVSPDLFDLLGVSPAIGRSFMDEEDLAGAAVVVISHRLWQSRFGGRPDILGAKVDIDRRPHEIIGVMPADFELVYERSDVWTPLGIHRGNIPRPNATFIRSVVRLRPGATLPQLAAEVNTVMADLANESPNTHRGWTARVRTLHDATFGEQKAPLLLLLGGVVALALIAAVNLTNLAIARFATRRHELAVRRAIGATVWDLVRAELAGVLLIAAVGAAAGIVLAANALPLMIGLNPQITLPAEGAHIDWRVAAAAAVFALLTALGPAMAPVLGRAGEADAESLASGNRRMTKGSSRLQFGMVAGQTSLAMALLASAFFLFAAFDRTQRVDVGYDADGVLTTQLRLSEAAYSTPESRVSLLDRTLEALRASPGVTEGASTMNPLIPGFSYVTAIEPNDPPAPQSTGFTVQFRRISDGYFRTMRIPILAGRDFDSRDRAGSELVAMVNRTFIERFWPGETGVGRRVRRGPDFAEVLTVVGITGDIRDVQVSQAPQPMLYLPYRQNNNASTPLSLVVRTSGQPSGMARTIAQAVWSADADQPLSRTRPMTQFLDESIGPQRFTSILLAVFAGVGLALAAVGIVGVTARTSAERTREIGVRIALGGLAGAVWWSVVRRPFTAVAAGAIAGLAVAYGAARVLAANLDGAQGLSPVLGWPGALLLVVVAIVAAAVPSYRATHIDPVTALRSGSD